jgi:HAD superfamily hydrolase (TIGR01549 family)
MSSRGRWVCFDVGETLIDETRIWSIWADVLQVPRLTFLAALGAVIDRGMEYRDVFGVVGAHDWEEHRDAVEEAYGGFRPDDLYGDAIGSLAGVRAAGHRVAVVANQPSIRAEQLRRIGIEADVVGMSEALGVAKPDPAFYARALDLMGNPEPVNVAYVGDRVDNDVLPSAAAGMRSVWLRRGPWGVLQSLPAGLTPALVVDSLDEFAGRIGEVWG